MTWWLYLLVWQFLIGPDSCRPCWCCWCFWSCYPFLQSDFNLGNKIFLRTDILVILWTRFQLVGINRMRFNSGSVSTKGFYENPINFTFLFLLVLGNKICFDCNYMGVTMMIIFYILVFVVSICFQLFLYHDITTG